MKSYSSFARESRNLLFGLLAITITSSGLPLVLVHSHADGTVAHQHDAHEHLQHGSAFDNADGNSTAGEPGSMHAHEIGAQGVAISMPVTIETETSVFGQSYGQPVADRPPDKIPATPFRPPIA